MIKRRRIEWVGSVVLFAVIKLAYRISAENLEGKILFGRLKRRWEAIKVEFRKWEKVTWTGFSCFWIWASGVL
jgi:hypothetical protein